MLPWPFTAIADIPPSGNQGSSGPSVNSFELGNVSTVIESRITDTPNPVPSQTAGSVCRITSVTTLLNISFELFRESVLSATMDRKEKSTGTNFCAGSK